MGLSVNPLEKLPEKEHTPTLVYIGRLKRHKLPDHALQAFTLIRKRLPDSKMWVIGDGTMLEQLKKINIDGVTFYGHVENTLKYDLLKRAHLLLMPSVREGWGLVVTEANAMGTPVIAYNVPGLRDSVMDEKTGILLNENSPQKLAEAAIYLLTDMNA